MTVTGCATTPGVTDEDVLAAVIDLWRSYRAPSTSLIIGRLAGGRSVGGAFQSAVRDSLERLHAHGDLSRVTHRGTSRWTPRAPQS